MRLTRLTTEYGPDVDRIRLAGETGPDDAVVMWLTRRLLDRLLPHLLEWLVARGADRAQPGDRGYGELLQGMAQQSARAALPAQPPVDAARAGRDWLVRSVDISTDASVVRLGFAVPDEGEPITLDFEQQPLRQWLNIVHDRYRQAGWPMDLWPTWMTEAARPTEPAGAVLH
jgi:hypothetical protein